MVQSSKATPVMRIQARPGSPVAERYYRYPAGRWAQRWDEAGLTRRNTSRREAGSPRKSDRPMPSWHPVSRFRSSLDLAATSGANFGIKGTLANLLTLVWFLDLKFLREASCDP